MTKFCFECGDIINKHVDAIVNAANSSLVGGGGVDGAIHRAGGPSIMAACDKIRRSGDGCPTGSAVITTAGDLDARCVIHTAGPIWRGGDDGEAEALACCYTSSLNLAKQNKMRTVALPSISTGVYGYPLEAAAEIAVVTIAGIIDDSPQAFDEITMVLFVEHDLEVYRDAYRELFG